jgi:8-oxo-dGTP diphosphatase
MKQRVAGIFIKDKKLLLVRAYNHTELWTPGGTPEKEESQVECLRRELKEEVSASLKSSQFFKEFVEDSPYLNKKVNNNIYLVELEGEFKPSNEIEEIVWVSRKDFDSKKYKYVYIIEQEIIPELIKKNLF